MRRYLVIQISITIILLLLGNIAISILSRNSIPRQHLREFEKASRATDVFLGNSTIASGVDSDFFLSLCPDSVPINIALQSTTPVEHLLIYAKLENLSNNRLFYGFFGTQLTDELYGDSESLTGTRSMAYYVMPELAEQVMPFNNAWLRFCFRLQGRFPAFVERFKVWAKVEKFRRMIDRIGLPPEESSAFGRAKDFQLLDATTGDLASNCQDVVKNQKPFSLAVTRLLSLARERDVKVMMIEMPRSSSYRNRVSSKQFWKNYRAHLVGLMSGGDANYIDATDWIPDEEFVDNLHLSPSGSRRFTARLVEWMKRR
jgi:hypothetical protein